MSTPNSSLRQRGGHKEKKAANGPVPVKDDPLDAIIRSTKQAATSEWDFKLAFAIITALAFITRFWGIGHPNEVVFDEVHFGKVCLYRHEPYML